MMRVIDSIENIWMSTSKKIKNVNLLVNTIAWNIVAQTTMEQ